MFNLIRGLGRPAARAGRRVVDRFSGNTTRSTPTGSATTTPPPRAQASSQGPTASGGGRGTQPMSGSSSSGAATTTGRESAVRRLGSSLGPGGSTRNTLRRGGKIGAAALALEGAVRLGTGGESSPIRGLLNAFRGGSTPQEEFDYFGAVAPFVGSPATENETDRFRRYFMGDGDTAAEFQFQQPALPDFVGSERSAAAQDRRTLEDWLASSGEYSRNQAQAISDAYQGMSQNLLQSSGDIFQRGQTTASDIDRLYATLAGENLDTVYGEGLSTPVSDVGGLAAPSGAAVSAADTTRTYGRSLADYLGQEAGVESAALEQMAGSQALQGAALAQSLRDYVAMSENDRRMELGRELTARERAAVDRQAAAEFEMQRELADYNRQLAQQLFGFEGVDRERAQFDRQIRAQDAATAANLWTTASREQRAVYERIAGASGQEGLERFVEFIANNPEYLVALGARA